MEILTKIGKFILGAVLKVFVIILAVLLVWLFICILMEDGFKEGIKTFVHSKVTQFVLGWVLGSWIGIIEGFKTGSIQTIIAGLLMFFAPIILLAITTPDPDIELYDSSGNLWKLRKG